MLKKVLDVISAANTLTLPMDTRAIADHFGYPIQLYSRAREQIKNMGVEELAARRLGFCACDGIESFIFLSDDLNVEQERFIIAHELGHIILGHVHPGLIKSYSPEEREAKEEQADLFALLLCAPAPLLDALRAKGPADISHYTHLSMTDSREAYKHLERYRRDQQEAARREDIANRARLAMQPSAPVDIPALFSNPEVSIYIHQLLAATVPQLEKAVG